jgi:adenine-specific DNA methylase
MVFETQDIFGRRDLSYIKDEFKYLPLNYVGSKKKLLPWIWRCLESKNIDFDFMLDPFSGSGVVSYFMRLLDKKVYSNDILSASYYNILSLVENNKSILTTNEIEWLTSHQIIDGKLKDDFFDYSDIDHYNEHNFTDNYFTLKEAMFLDCFFYKLSKIKDFFDLIDEEYIYKKALCYSALFAFTNLLPFGSAEGTNLFEYRKKQKDKYKNRCKGFYLDNEYNLHLYWLSNYMEKFSKFAKMAFNKPQGKAFNQNVFSFLQNDFVKDADLIYFDPPYGGSTSGYMSIYGFLENFINQQSIEDENRKIGNLFSGKNYENNFRHFLSLSESVKYWIFSYNSNSWKDIDDIVDIINEHKCNIDVMSYEDSLQKRGKMTNGKNYVEFLIIAQ